MACNDCCIWEKLRYEIVTRKDEVKIVPKEHTVFRMEVPFAKVEGEVEEKKPLVFEILGGQFEQRAPDRANKKFRMHMDPDV